MISSNSKIKRRNCVPYCLWNRSLGFWSNGPYIFNGISNQTVMATPFEFKSLVMPFGLANAPGRFQQSVERYLVFKWWQHYWHHQRDYKRLKIVLWHYDECNQKMDSMKVLILENPLVLSRSYGKMPSSFMTGFNYVAWIWKLSLVC